MNVGSNPGILSQIIEGGGIEPGSPVGYELCKLIYRMRTYGRAKDGTWTTVSNGKIGVYPCVTCNFEA